jgi:hypothetical protein
VRKPRHSPTKEKLMSFDMQMVEPPKQLPPAYVAQYEERPGNYSLNTSAMVIMVTVMEAAGILGDDPVPQWPAWPPKGIAPERLKLLEEAVSEEKIKPELTDAERRLATSAIEDSKRVRSTRSKKLDRVPAFKFRSNDGWLVTSEECGLIAAGLRRFAERLKQEDLEALDKQYQESQKKLMEALPPGHVVLSGNQPLGLTLPELKQWVMQWAAFNALAEKNGGYLVQ